MTSRRIANTPPHVISPLDDDSGDAAFSSASALLRPDAWRQTSPYAWVCGRYSICAVRVKGELQFELWKDSEFLGRAADAATLRTIAAGGGAVE